LTFLSNIRIFGSPYLNIEADLSWENIKKNFFRPAPQSNQIRPPLLKVQDKTKEGNQ
jgi:spore germination protein KA